MNEDKQITCDALTIALATTRQFDDLLRLEYVKGEDFEVVIPHFRGGRGRSINVQLDSCWALIKDVVNHLEG
ncbi:MAG: hypothetical protein IKE37_04695 [Firmicutes bacterium]|nr:hypothetical protein [Bacillota bacterium]